jgi:acyl-CoA thioesterase-1
VAGVPSLNQADGIHPTADGQRRIADLIWPALAPAVGLRASS